MHSDYLERFYAGETLALARLMSRVERGGEVADELLTTLFPRTGSAYRIGITGITGSGKSTLIAGLIAHYRTQSLTVGVIAEDPSSPYSGGAILGDRVRMVSAAGDDGVFIRSVASRGSETGFSAGANELADVLDAFGRDVIILETIGIGQLEYRIRACAHTTVVVLTPESGDEVQGMKSGLMEIGEVFVVNKADRPGADRFADEIRSVLELRAQAGQWLAPVVTMTASEGRGIDALAQAIDAHRVYLENDGRMGDKRASDLRQRTLHIAEERLRELFRHSPVIKDKLDAVMADVAAGRTSPYEAAARLVAPIRIDKK